MGRINDSDDVCPACNAQPGEAHTILTDGGSPCTPQSRAAKVESLKAQLKALGANAE